MVVLFVLLTIIVLLTIDYFVQRAERAKHPVSMLAAATARTPLQPVPASLPVDRVPQGVFVDPGHVWVQLEPTGAFRMGVDMFPAALLGRPDRIEVSPAGTEVRRGDPIATLRRGKRSVTLRCPVDGTISKVNSEAQADPSRLQGDPFGQGWLYWVTPREIAPALKGMFVAEEATSWARQQLQKLRDLLADLAGGGQLAGATAQDGGVPVEGLSDHLDDDRFQRLVDQFFATRP